MKNYIFGTGAFAAEVAKRLDKFGIDIECFINIRDKNKSGNFLFKWPDLFAIVLCYGKLSDFIYSLTSMPTIYFLRIKI